MNAILTVFVSSVVRMQCWVEFLVVKVKVHRNVLSVQIRAFSSATTKETSLMPILTLHSLRRFYQTRPIPVQTILHSSFKLTQRNQNLTIMNTPPATSLGVRPVQTVVGYLLIQPKSLLNTLQSQIATSATALHQDGVVHCMSKTPVYLH